MKVENWKKKDKREGKKQDEDRMKGKVEKK